MVKQGAGGKEQGAKCFLPAVKNGCIDHCLDDVFFDLPYASLGST
jgi:hypothetical protein